MLIININRPKNNPTIKSLFMIKAKNRIEQATVIIVDDKNKRLVLPLKLDF